MRFATPQKCGGGAHKKPGVVPARGGHPAAKSSLPPPAGLARLRSVQSGKTAGPKEKGYQLKVDAARAVGYRETLLMQLNAVVLHWPQQHKGTSLGGARSSEANRLLRNLAAELRKAGLRCVEKIVAWVLNESAEAASPLPFYWNGKDYLLKMADDLDFVADTIGSDAWHAGCFCRGNPLLLTEAEIRGEGPTAKIGRLQAGSVIILDVVRRHRQRVQIKTKCAREAQLATHNAKLEKATGVYKQDHSPTVHNAGDDNAVEDAPHERPRRKHVPPINFDKHHVGEIGGRGGARGVRALRAAAEKPEKVEQNNAPAAADSRKEPERPVNDEKQPQQPVDETPSESLEDFQQKMPKHIDDDDDDDDDDDKGSQPTQRLQPRMHAMTDESLEAEHVVEIEDAPAEVVLDEAPAAVDISPRNLVRTPVEIDDEQDDDYSMDVDDEEDEQSPVFEKRPESDYLDQSQASSDMVETDPGAADMVEAKNDQDESDLSNDNAKTPVEMTNASQAPFPSDRTNENDDSCAQDDDSIIEASSAIPSLAAQYEIDELLGEGAYGVVYSATHRKSGRRHAIKKLKLTADGDEEDEEMANYAVATAQRELKILQCLGVHANIVEFTETWNEQASVPSGKFAMTTPVLVFELLTMTALQALDTQTTPGFSRELCVSFMRDLCSSLDHIHSLNIVHRDVKPENVLLTATPANHTIEHIPTLKLCDFGAARHLNSNLNGLPGAGDLTHYIGSRWYRAPEMMAGCTNYGLPVDIWSAACIMAEFATGNPLFPGEDELSVLSRVTNVVGPFPPHLVAELTDHGVPPHVLESLVGPYGLFETVQGGALAAKIGEDAIALLRRMLCPNVDDRLTASECLASPVLNNVVLAPRTEVEAGSVISDALDEPRGVRVSLPLHEDPQVHPREPRVEDTVDWKAATSADEDDESTRVSANTAPRDTDALSLENFVEKPDIRAMAPSPPVPKHTVLDASAYLGEEQRTNDAPSSELEDHVSSIIEQHPSWSVPGADLLRSAWLPVLVAGATAALKVPEDLAIRAVPSLGQARTLFPDAADALMAPPSDSVDAWVASFMAHKAPCGVIRTLIRTLRWIIDVAVVPRVAMCRDWLLAQQQRGEITLIQAVDAVELEVGVIDTVVAARARTAARVLQLAYHNILRQIPEHFTDVGASRSRMLEELASPDAVVEDDSGDYLETQEALHDDNDDDDDDDKSAPYLDAAQSSIPKKHFVGNDQGAGSDVGARSMALDEASMSTVYLRENVRGAVEERFHVRSVNEALAVVTPMLVDTEVASIAKTQGVKKLEALLGLPCLKTHAALLRPASKAALLYVALSRKPPRRLNLVTSRKTAWEDCEHLLSRYTSCLDAAAAKAVVERPRMNCIDDATGDDRVMFGEGKAIDSMEDSTTHENHSEGQDSASDEGNASASSHSSFVICPYYRAPFGQKYVEGVAVEEGEGLGPRKELFSILAETARRNWAPVSPSPARLLIGARQRSDAPNMMRLVVDDTPAGRDGFIDDQKRSIGIAGAPVPAAPSIRTQRPPLLAPGYLLAVEVQRPDDDRNEVLELIVEQVLANDQATTSNQNEYVVRLSTSSSELSNALDATVPLQENSAIVPNTRESKLESFFASLVGSHVQPRINAQPLLVHRKDLEALWLNPALPQTAANARRLAMLGMLIGSAVSNQCQLPLELPPLLFKALGVVKDCQLHADDASSMGLDAEENVFRRGARCLVPRLIGDFLLADDSRGNLFLDEGKLSLLDPSYAETSLSIEGLDDANFEALLELEGLNQTSLTEDPLAQAMGWFSPDDGTGSHGARIRSAYSKRSSLERSCELEWQLRAMRRGFERAMPLSVRRVVRPSAQDLQRIVCGAPEFTGDFRFREVFRIVMDAELRDCRPLHDALWAVIDGDDYDDSECERQHASSEATFKEAPYHFTHAQRRKLLKFITGVTRLPAKHTEFMTIELPFLPFGVDEQRRMLAMIPQSHTCDNILELPNYWEALLKTRYPQSSHDPPERGSLDSDCLENELRKLLYEKLVIAIENAEGYGLDALEPHVSAALASAAAGDDTASEVMRGVMHDDLATRRRSSSHDYMNDDDDDDGGDPNVIGASFASIPALDAESEAELSEPPSEGLLRGDASDSQCANNAGQTTLDESSNDVAMEAATLLGLDDDESPRREPGGMRSQVEVSGEQPISPDDDEIADLLREAEKHFEQSPAQDTTRARNLIDDEATPRRDDGATNVEDEDDYEFEFSFQPQSSTHEDEDDFDFDEVDLLA